MRFLLATDGSPHAEEAARFMTRFALSAVDEVVVLHVISEIPYADDHHANIRRFLRKIAPKILRASVDILAPYWVGTAVIEMEGSPDEAIISTAVDRQAELIVMGARGLKGIKSYLVGSVTRSVATRSPIPVLVTKASAGDTKQPLRVLVATDGSSSSLSAAGLLSSIPLPSDSAITVMNVAWSPAEDLPERFASEIDERFKKDMAAARAIEFKEAERLICEVASVLTPRFKSVSCLTRGGDPAAEILAQATSGAADLVVLGNRGLHGMRSILGSVSRRVLAHAPCAVLIGREPRAS